MVARPGTQVLAVAAALITVTLWASAFVGIRAAGADFEPGALALGRLCVGAIGLGAMVVVRGWVQPTRRDLVLIVAAGLLWFAFYNVALNAAERNLDAGTASMLVNLGPIFIAVLAGLFLGEGLPVRLLTGCLIAFGGTAVIGLATSSTQAPGANPILGIVLCVASALAYAGGVTLQKPAVAHVPALQVTWICCLVGAVACLPFAPGLASEIVAARPESTAWMVYLGLFPTAIGFTTWAYALRHTPAGRLGSTTYLVPPVVIALAWLLLGEVPPTAAMAGGVLCIGGVVVARSRRFPRLRTPEPRQA
jgi:drug/metabolite transporter (DMT)-like permease